MEEKEEQCKLQRVKNQIKQDEKIKRDSFTKHVDQIHILQERVHSILGSRMNKYVIAMVLDFLPVPTSVFDDFKKEDGKDVQDYTYSYTCPFDKFNVLSVNLKNGCGYFTRTVGDKKLVKYLSPFDSVDKWSNWYQVSFEIVKVSKPYVINGKYKVPDDVVYSKRKFNCFGQKYFECTFDDFKNPHGILIGFQTEDRWNPSHKTFEMMFSHGKMMGYIVMEGIGTYAVQELGEEVVNHPNLLSQQALKVPRKFNKSEKKRELWDKISYQLRYYLTNLTEHL